VLAPTAARTRLRSGISGTLELAISPDQLREAVARLPPSFEPFHQNRRSRTAARVFPPHQRRTCRGARLVHGGRSTGVNGTPNRSCTWRDSGRTACAGPAALGDSRTAGNLARGCCRPQTMGCPPRNGIVATAAQPSLRLLQVGLRPDQQTTSRIPGLDTPCGAGPPLKQRVPPDACLSWHLRSND